MPSVIFLCVVSSAAFPEPVRPAIGVYDQGAAGGQGASVDGLIAGLLEQGWPVRRLTDLNELSLCEVDLLYLSDMHDPGLTPRDWKGNLYAFIEAGGGLLQTWHHHSFHEVGVGVRRVYDSRKMHIVSDHPAVEGLQDFEASFKDHIVDRVGTQGTPVILNDSGDPVAVAGRIGKGKVVSTGLALCIPDGRSSIAPRGEDLRVLRAFLNWLKPERSREKRLLDLLQTPKLEVWPPEVSTAAGFEAAFVARVGLPVQGQVELSFEDNGSAEILETGETPLVQGGPHLREYTVRVKTPDGKGSERRCVVQARAGEMELQESVSVVGVFGPVPDKERRGVWLHVKEDRPPNAVMPELKRLGINMAVLRIAGGTAAFYASKVQKDIQDPLADEGGDWLKEAVKHAHRNGIEIHPYVNNCIVEGRTSPESLEMLYQEGRLQVGPEGERINWFCPSQEANIAFMEKVMFEIVTDYDVDGIQYDFIRYPGPSGCFCSHCRSLFEKETGKPVTNWPEDVLSEGPLHEAWIEFRCDRISRIVERISNGIRERKQDVKISAAVFRDWPQCRRSHGQDWKRWCEEGWLDMVCPMNYTLDPHLFQKRAKIHREAVEGRVPILQGIGIHSGQGKMTLPQALAVQIAMSRAAGASGFVCFCYQPEHTKSLFGPLRSWLGIRQVRTE